MSRQSLRKVKLTSKFEEFSTSRLASIQRLAHPDTNGTPAANQQQQQDGQPETPQHHPLKQERLERSATKVAREQPKIVETPRQPTEAATNNVVHKERTPHKALRHKVSSTPITPASHAFESQTPSPYGHMTPMPKLTANGKIRGRPRKIWQQKAETVVKPMSSAREELLRLREETTSLRTQLEQVRNEYEELKRQSSYTGQTVPKVDYDDLKAKYHADLMNAKRREWCVVCLNRSRYHCCWNTTYCSQKCQVHDWYQRHLKSCERLKAPKTIS